MRIRIWSNWLLGLALLLVVVACTAPRPERLSAPPPQHVFLIVIDTLRADHLGFHGYSRDVSPFMDRLARDGAVFEQHFSTASNTLEGVFSLLTSTTSLANNVYAEGVPARLRSLQKSFSLAEFNTMAVIANPWLKYHEGFFTDGFRHTRFVNDELGEHWGANTSEQVTQIAIEFLHTRFDPAGRNFFYLHHLDPHDIYAAPLDYGFYEGPELKPRPMAHPLSGEDAVHRGIERDPQFRGRPTPLRAATEAVTYLRAQYDSEIRFIDAQIEALVQELERMGVLKESLIVITSDHGEEFLEHGMLKHGFQLFDETIHVPLLVYGPRFVSRGRDARVVSGIDVAPTLLGLAGLAVPPSMLGHDLFLDDVERPALMSSHFLNQEMRGMRTSRFKIIEDRILRQRAIYDLRADAQETQALQRLDSSDLTAFLALYDQLLLEHTRQDRDIERLPAPELDAETRDQLESLGYAN